MNFFKLLSKQEAKLKHLQGIGMLPGGLGKAKTAEECPVCGALTFWRQREMPICSVRCFARSSRGGNLEK